MKTQHLKVLIIVIATTLLSHDLKGQTTGFQLGLFLEPTVITQRYKDHLDIGNISAPYVAHLAIDKALSNRFKLEGGLGYYLVAQYEATSNSIIGFYYQGISFPLYGKFYLGTNKRFYVGTGLNVNLLLGIGFIDYSFDFDLLYNLNKIDIGAVGLIGYTLPITDRFSIDARLLNIYGINNLGKDDPLMNTIRYFKTNISSISIGGKYAF